MSQRYTDFTFTKTGNLIIKVLPEQREEVMSWKDRDSDDAEMRLIEYQLSNGWEVIKPEEIGALTGCLILSQNTIRDGDGDLVNSGTIYTNLAWYQLRGLVHEALSDDGAFFAMERPA